MDDLVESIRNNGVLSSVIVGSTGEDTYEMVSDHRRMHACKLAGLTMIPAIVCEMTDDEAIEYMVDSKRLQFAAAVEISYLDKTIQGCH